MAKYSSKELIELISNSTSFDSEAKSQLIYALRQEKKYGLVWENSSEESYETMRSAIPFVKECSDRAVISSDGNCQNHILIEGDNLNAITSLCYTHEGDIDVIYIDPPYNTGASNWKYNNDYVDKEDQFRHSKFISFINRRLCIAKRLLSEEGIIICAIDDYEIHNVRALMDEIFGEENRLGTITVVHNPRGRNDDTFIATMHEYLLVYAKNHVNAVINDFPLSEEDIAAYKKEDEISRYNETSFIRTGNNSLRTERPGLWYEIYYNPSTNRLSLEKTSEEDVVLLPINEKGEERCWRWGPETFMRDKNTELFVKKVKGEYKVYKKRRLTEEIGRKPRTVWTDSKYDASSNGIMLLQKIFDGKCPFPYPKSLYAVYDCLAIASKKNSKILDFFAGSGTTLHATMQLNADDGGTRQCILVTNNENNICEEVTYVRNKKVIEGYTTLKGQKIDGLSGNNLRYFKINMIDRSYSHQSKRDFVYSSTDLLRIKENCYVEQSSFGKLNLLGKEKMVRYFEEDGRRLLIIYDYRVVPFIVKEIESMPLGKDEMSIYIFADGSYPYTEDFRTVLDKIKLTALPYAINQALKHILPAADDINIDNAELSEDEKEQLISEAIESEKNEQ